jgi:hypothetical protein
MSGARNDKKHPIKKLDPARSAYSTDAMTIAIAAKKERLLAHHQEWNCFVINEYYELTEFFIAIQQQLLSFPHTMRFQFVYFATGHWLSADVNIKHGKVEVFLMDSLSYAAYLREMIQIIKKAIPDTKITYSFGDEIQHDVKNCGTFALDHAIRMSMIVDLHDSLDLFSETARGKDTVSNDLQPYNNDGSLRMIAVKDFPPTMAPLLRNMQSISTLRDLFYNKGYYANDHLSLEDYVSKHEKNTMVGRQLIVENKGIRDRRIKLKEKATIFFNDIDTATCAAILKNRTGKHGGFFKPFKKQAETAIKKHGKKTTVCQTHGQTSPPNNVSLFK